MKRGRKPAYARNNSVKFRLEVRGSSECFGEVTCTYGDTTKECSFSYEFDVEGYSCPFFITERSLRRA